MLGLQALPDGVRGGGLRSGKHAGAPRSVGVVLLRAGNKDTLIDLVGERDAVLGHIQERRSSAGERRLWPAPVLARLPLADRARCGLYTAKSARPFGARRLKLRVPWAEDARWPDSGSSLRFHARRLPEDA